jgi:hypothetical protein
MRRLDHRRHFPQLDLFRPAASTLEWHQLPVAVCGKATRLMVSRHTSPGGRHPRGEMRGVGHGDLLCTT